MLIINGTEICYMVGCNLTWGLTMFDISEVVTSSGAAPVRPLRGRIEW